MAFNGNGVFNRLYNWVADAAGGIKILATKMDGEMNGIAAGLSNCVTRDGQSPPSVDLPMGGKKLVNLGNGTVSTDAATFGQLGNYLPLIGGTLTGALSGTSANFSGAITSGSTLTVSAGGINVTGSSAFNSGLSITGSATVAGGLFVTSGGITVTGNSSVNGNVTASGGGTFFVGSNAVWHAGNFTPGSYALLTGAAFSGTITVSGDTNFGLNKAGGNPRLSLGAANTYLEWTGTKLVLVVAGTTVFSADGSGNLKAAGSITASTTP
jgi:hypothetical protein